MGTGPTNSAAPTTSTVIGGVRNVTPPTPADTQAVALQVDANGNLFVATLTPVSGVGSGDILSTIGISSTNIQTSFIPAHVIAYFNPSNSSSQLARTVNVFKTASVAATVTGNSAVWTPAAGKKFRLMRFQITAQGLAATAAGVVTVSFQDNVTGITIGTYDVNVPAVAGVVSGVTQVSGWVDLQQGFLSAAVNNVLNFNISAAGAGTVGTYRVNVCGTEE